MHTQLSCIPPLPTRRRDLNFHVSHNSTTNMARKRSSNQIVSEEVENAPAYSADSPIHEDAPPTYSTNSPVHNVELPVAYSANSPIHNDAPPVACSADSPIHDDAPPPAKAGQEDKITMSDVMVFADQLHYDSEPHVPGTVLYFDNVEMGNDAKVDAVYGRKGNHTVFCNAALLKNPELMLDRWKGLYNKTYNVCVVLVKDMVEPIQGIKAVAKVMRCVVVRVNVQPPAMTQEKMQRMLQFAKRVKLE